MALHTIFLLWLINERICFAYLINCPSSSSELNKNGKMLCRPTCCRQTRRQTQSQTDRRMDGWMTGQPAAAGEDEIILEEFSLTCFHFLPKIFFFSLFFFFYKHPPATLSENARGEQLDNEEAGHKKCSLFKPAGWLQGPPAAARVSSLRMEGTCGNTLQSGELK